ncbi:MULTISPECIES: ArsR/SmtB family transcription factor [unclassified Solwaraspora]|uniref:ArsR/SmtB family transcription factor n=1 Tax=unclassified Solwaraspora TaxID=2627926 RepID=UPI00259BF17A|nr:winged helix-turn-helix domain-containing protein [Solwaraspora sp. WMMA2056]WJK40060.1 winged helix-turn-helix domain-containing protein [Solwaraspora sp. WMMA2056]
MAHQCGESAATTAAVRVLDGVSALRAVADPIRLQVLGVLTAEPQQSYSARQLAHRLGITFSLMHYHLRVLTEEGMVRVVSQRTGHGRAERCFQTAQLALRWEFPPVSGEGCPPTSGGDQPG